MPGDVPNQRGCLISCSGEAVVLLPSTLVLVATDRKWMKQNLWKNLKFEVKPANMKHLESTRARQFVVAQFQPAKGFRNQICAPCAPVDMTATLLSKYLSLITILQISLPFELCGGIYLGKHFGNLWWNEKKICAWAHENRPNAHIDSVGSIESVGCCQRLNLNQFFVKNNPSKHSIKIWWCYQKFPGELGAEVSTGNNLIALPSVLCAPTFSRSVWWCLGGGWLCFRGASVVMLCCDVMWWVAKWRWSNMVGGEVTWGDVRWGNVVGCDVSCHVMWCGVLSCHVMVLVMR